MPQSITQIVNEFGARYTENGPGQAEIIKKIRAGNTTTKYFQGIMTDKSHVRSLHENMDVRVQSYQKDFTPAGSAEIQGKEQKIYPLKIDETLDPDELFESYLGYMAERKVDPKDMPFVKYVVDIYMEDAVHKLEQLAYYHGNYVAPTAGTPGVTAACMDGIGTQIGDAITAGSITPITTSAITDEDSVEGALKQFILGMGANTTAVDYIFMSAHNAQLLSFKLDRRSDGSGKELNPLAPFEVPYGNKVIVGLTSMGTSDRIWATPRYNRKHYYNASKRMMMQPDKRLVHLLIDWNEALVLDNPRQVFVNDKA